MVRLVGLHCGLGGHPGSPGLFSSSSLTLPAACFPPALLPCCSQWSGPHLSSRLQSEPKKRFNLGAHSSPTLGVEL